MNIFPVSAANHDVPYPTPLYTIVLDKKFITPYTQNWSLTFEHELRASFLARVGYVGTTSVHLKSEYDQNAPIYDPAMSLTQNRATIDDRRPVQDFQTISRWMHGLNSTYHALQVSLDKRYSHGVTVSTNYTWSKNLDYVSRNGFGGSRGINNPFNFFFSRGNSDFTRTHRFVNSFVWDLPALPKGSVTSAVLGNWRLSGITTLQSGRPFTIGASNNPTAGAGSARADLVGTGYPVLDTGRSKGEELAAYFDTTRFVNPAPNTFGTLGRNVLFGPGFAQRGCVDGQRLAPAVLRRGRTHRVPVRGVQPVQRDAPERSGHRHHEPELWQNHRYGWRSQDPTDGPQSGLVTAGGYGCPAG